MEKALEIALVKAVDSSGTTQEKTAGILFNFMDRAADMAFRRSRSPGGRAASRRPRARRGRFSPMCRLCDNPMIKDPSTDEIVAHASHGQGLMIEDKGTHIEATINESAVEKHPDGTDVIECEDCTKGTPHVHGEH